MNHHRLSGIIAQLACAACLGCGGVDDPDAPMLGFSDGHGTGGPNAVGPIQGSPPSGGAAPGSNENPGGAVDGAGGAGIDAGAGFGGAAGSGTDDGTITGPVEAAPGGPPEQPATATGSATIMDNVGESGNDQVPGFYGAGADIGLRERPGP